MMSVLLRIFPSTIVLLRIGPRRCTILIRAQVIRRKTVVYDRKRTIDSRSRPFTEFVILDLGSLIFPGRRRTAGNDRFLKISCAFQGQVSEIGSCFRFRLNSRKFWYTNLINMYGCRFQSGVPAYSFGSL